MNSLLISLLLVAPSAFACDVMFLDFNNSGKEISNCRDGVKQCDPRDDVNVVGYNSRVTAASVEAAFRDSQKRGSCIDSLVISGHQIAGEFSGENGAISSKALAKIIAKYPSVAGDNLETSQLWGCYSTVLIRCKNNFLKSLSPSIKTAVGYTLQSPSNERAADHAAAHFLCENRAKAAKAQDEARLNDYVKSLADYVNKKVGKSNLAIGICTEDAVCSRNYRAPDQKNESCYHTWDELMARCSSAKDFDPHGALAEMYDRYYAADDNAHAEPPGDEEDAFSEEEGKTVHSPLRAFYAKGPNLWAHCAEKYKHDFNYTMPAPGQVIRLIKFRELKSNIQKLHGAQLAQYDRALDEAGLGKYKLRDLSTMNRKEIKDDLEGVLNAVGDGSARPRKRARAGGNVVSDFFGGLGAQQDQAAPARAGADLKALSVMANNLKSTLIDLDGACSSANLLHPEGASVQSRCIHDMGSADEQ